MVEADLILSNGIFFTVNSEQPEAEALAIKNDRILAVGKYSEINTYRGKMTRILDLHGAFGCPGFNDSHIHLLDAGLAAEECDLTGVQSIPEVRRIVNNKIRSTAAIAWILGRGWDQDLLLEGEWPDKSMLDRVAYTWPVYLTRKCGCVAWVNSRALMIANITDKTPDPPGGEIVRDPRTGKPTGILKGKAMELVSQYILPPFPDAVNSSIRRAVREVTKYGITTVQDNSSPEALDLFQALLDQDQLTCRITKELPFDINPRLYQQQFIEKQNNLMLRIGCLSATIDGSIASRTAVFSQPYFDDPVQRGLFLMDRERLENLFYFADSRQFQIAVGAVGDAAAHMFLDLYERTSKVNRTKSSRHRLEQAQIVSPGDLSRIKALGVVVSMQPFQCVDDMSWLEARIGPERCHYAHIWRSLKNQGAKLAFGSDWPFGPLNPMLGLYAAVTRRDTLGYPLEGWFPHERLTIEEAIEAYTLGSAYAEFMEKEKGSLEPGKLADIVIVDRNLLQCMEKDSHETVICLCEFHLLLLSICF
jgi:predicted amidohydrolase YtcJ